MKSSALVVGAWAPSHRRPNASERRLIALLREMGLPVVPQATNGRWTLDAYLPKPISAAVEVDGPAYHTNPEDSARDRRREADLRKEGLIVIRAWSPDLYTPEGRSKIRKHIITRVFRDRGIQLKTKGARKIINRLR